MRSEGQELHHELTDAERAAESERVRGILSRDYFLRYGTMTKRELLRRGWPAVAGFAGAMSAVGVELATYASRPDIAESAGLAGGSSVLAGVLLTVAREFRGYIRERREQKEESERTP